jgi:hypothetical protein
MVLLAVDRNIDDGGNAIGIGPLCCFKRRAKVVGRLHALCPAAGSACDGHKVKVCMEFGCDHPPAKGGLLRPPWPAKRSVVEDNPHHWCSFLDGCWEFMEAHLECTVPSCADNRRLRPRKFGADRAADAKPHCGLLSWRNDSVALANDGIWPVIGPQILGAVLVDEDAVAVEHAADHPGHAFATHWHLGVVRVLRSACNGLGMAGCEFCDPRWV